MSKRHTIDEQKALIRKARAGDGVAASELIENAMPFLRNLAAQIARRTGAYKVEEDLFQEACLALFERIPHYDLDSSARFEFYAYQWITARVKELACESLEIVRLPRDAHAHAAHRDIERGEDPDVVAAKHKLPRDAVDALVRHTVDLSAYVHTEHLTDDVAETDSDLYCRAWSRLPDHHRRVLSCCIEHHSIAARLGVWRWMRWISRPINAYDLRLLEQQAKRKLLDIVRAIDEATDGA